MGPPKDQHLPDRDLRAILEGKTPRLRHAEFHLERCLTCGSRLANLRLQGLFQRQQTPADDLHPEVDDIIGYAKGELPNKVAERIQDHLSTCQECQSAARSVALAHSTEETDACDVDGATASDVQMAEALLGAKRGPANQGRRTSSLTRLATADGVRAWNAERPSQDLSRLKARLPTVSKLLQQRSIVEESLDRFAGFSLEPVHPPPSACEFRSLDEYGSEWHPSFKGPHTSIAFNTDNFRVAVEAGQSEDLRGVDITLRFRSNRAGWVCAGMLVILEGVNTYIDRVTDAAGKIVFSSVTGEVTVRFGSHGVRLDCSLLSS